MVVRQLAGGWAVLAPAKLNLFLEVLARRSDGFHEIETLMAPIDVYDHLLFRDDPRGGLRLVCRWAAGLRKQPRLSRVGRTSDVVWEELPEGNDNVAMRAVALLRERAGIGSGAELQLTKPSPRPPDSVADRATWLPPYRPPTAVGG